jgi:hypothetical protein
MAGPVRIAAAGDFVVSTSSAASSIERRPAIAPANADGAGGVTAPNATEDLSEPSLLAGQGGIIARIADELPALLSSLRDVVKSGEATLGLPPTTIDPTTSCHRPRDSSSLRAPAQDRA